MDRFLAAGPGPRTVMPASALRVAYVAMRYPLASETFVTNDVRALSSVGVQVEVVPLRGNRLAGPELLAERGVDHVPVVPTARLVRGGWRTMLRSPWRALRDLAWFVGTSLGDPRALLAGLWLWPAAMGAVAHVERERHDVVHIRWGHHPSLVGALLRRRKAKPVVSVSLSAYDLVRRTPVSHWLVPRADVVRTVAQANVATIARWYGRDEGAIDVIHDAVPDDVLDAEPGAKRRGLVVTAARLLPGKRIDRVVRAFARAIAALPPDAAAVARLEVLGDGPQRAALEALARDLGVQERIAFRGMVPYAEVLATMRRAEVVVFLSDIASERLPNVVKEALASGCAVISSKTEGIEELIAPERSGILVDAWDVEQTAARLAELLSQPAIAASLGEAGRAAMRRGFRLSGSGRAYVAAWRRGLEGRRERRD